MTGPSSGAIKAGEAFVELSANDAGFTKSLERMRLKLAGIGSFLRKSGVATAAAGTAMLLPLVGSFKTAIAYGDQIQDVADRTNSTADAVSRLAYAADFSASSIQDVESANKVLTKSIVAAEKGGNEQAEALKKIGVSAEEFASTPIDQRFLMIAEALEAIEEPLQRDQFLLSLFGKQASAMLPLLGQGAAGIKALFDEAEKRGSVISPEDAQKSAQAMDMLDAVGKEVKNTIMQVGFAVLTLEGEMGGIVKTISVYLKMARDWVKDNKEIVATLVIVGVALTTVGVAGAALGVVIGGLTTLWGLATAAAGAFVAVLGLISLKVVLITAAIAGLVYIVGKLAGGFGNIGAMLKETFGGIVKALQTGQIEKAWKLIVLSLERTYLEFVIRFRSRWKDFANSFVDTFYHAVNAIKTFFVKLWAWVRLTLVETLNAIARPIAEITDWLEVTKGMVGRIDAITDTARKQIQQDKERDILALDQKEQDRIAQRNENDLVERANLLNRFKAIDDARKALLAELNAVPGAAPGVERAPMPRLRREDELFGKLGDSVRGLFESADFSGVLAIGPQNSLAKQQLDKLGNIETVLGQIRDRVDADRFT